MGFLGITVPKWVDEAARGAVTVATGGISEAIKSAGDVVSGKQDPIAAAANMALGAPVQMAIGAATAATAIYAGASGDSGPLNTVKDFREGVRNDPTKALGLAAAIVGAGAAIGAATGGPELSGAEKAALQKLPQLHIPNPRVDTGRTGSVAEHVGSGHAIAGEPTPRLPSVNPEEMMPGRHGIVNEVIGFVEKALGVDVPGFGIGK